MLPNIVLFVGEDAGASANLWETNGTAAGTFELTNNPSPPPPITGAASFGFVPNSTVSLDLTVFNDQVLFIGRVGPGQVGPYRVVDNRRHGHWHRSAGRRRGGFDGPFQYDGGVGRRAD